MPLYDVQFLRADGLQIDVVHTIDRPLPEDAIDKAKRVAAEMPEVHRLIVSRGGEVIEDLVVV